MKKLKKISSILLMFTMVVTMCTPAFAADTYSITIQNDKTGHTYEAYQIFEGDVSSDETQGGNAQGPILSNVRWGNGVDSTALLASLKQADNAKYGACTSAADVAKALGAENATAEDAEAFAKIAGAHLTNVAGTSDTPEGGNYIISNLDAGYYLVKDKDGSLEGDADVATEYIVQVLGNVTMNPKYSDVPTVEKKVSEEDYNIDDGYGYTYNDVADWDIGDSVPFKIIGSIPDMAAYDTYEYKFTDTLSNGLTLQADTIKVYIARDRDDGVNEYTPLTQGEHYTLNTQGIGGNGGGSFSIAFDNLKDTPYVGEADRNYVIVTYDATLNTNAEIGLDGNPNSVYLEYSNNPNGTGKGKTTEDKVVVFTYELDGTKVDGQEVTTKLDGAEFILFNGGHTRVAHIENGKMIGWINLPEGYDAHNYMDITYEEWTALNATSNVIMTSDVDGNFGVSGIDEGTYYLLEIKSPTGYNLMDENVRIDINATTTNGQTWNGIADALTAINIVVDQNEDDAQNGNVETGVVNLTVTNNQGSTLPETGGMGTTLFYIIGALLVIGAVTLLVVHLRMRNIDK